MKFAAFDMERMRWYRPWYTLANGKATVLPFHYTQKCWRGFLAKVWLPHSKDRQIILIDVLEVGLFMFLGS